ncbi:MAG: hypothetical protein WEB60_12910 [Terrimicrobiaceae bacterium]
MAAKTKAGAGNTVTFSPQEYVDFCISPRKLPPMRGAGIIVEGDVNLPELAGGDDVQQLRDAVIRGNLVADSGCSLSIIHACTVEGWCELSGSWIRSTSRKFRAVGNFKASGCKRLGLVSGYFGGDLSLSGSGVERLGHGLVCQGNLSLSGCERIKTVNCPVGGSLYLSNSSVEKFGASLQVGGDLWLQGCSGIRHLGECGNPTDVDISDSGVQEATASFCCRGQLTAGDCHILEHISQAARYRSLFLQRCMIKELDTGKTDGDICLEKCRNLKNFATNTSGKVRIIECGVTSLDDVSPNAKSLIVEDCLQIETIGGHRKGKVELWGLNGLRQISSDFLCEGDLGIWGCRNLFSLSGRVHGNTTICNAGQLWEIGPSFSTGGNFSAPLGSLRVEELGCHVGGNLSLSGCPIKYTSDTLHVEGNADLGKTGKLQFVRGLIGGNLVLDKSAVTLLDQDLTVNGNLSAQECDALVTVNCKVGGEARISGKRLPPGIGGGGAGGILPARQENVEMKKTGLRRARTETLRKRQISSKENERANN